MPSLENYENLPDIDEGTKIEAEKCDIIKALSIMFEEHISGEEKK